MNARNFFAIGLVLVLVGVQLRAVRTFVLNQQTSDFIEKRMSRNRTVRSEGIYESPYLALGPAPRKQLTHPRWVGLAFISVGAVMLLQGVSRRSE